MASLTDVLSVIQNGVIAFNNFSKQMAGSLLSISNQLTPLAVASPSGRLTLSTGVPVMTTTVSAATSVLYTPYQGNKISVPNSTGGFTSLSFTELSNVNSATTPFAGPAAVAASSAYDYFAWLSPTGLVLSRGPAWTNLTTRSAGTALVRQKGLLVNNVAITNGPPANMGLYLGSAASNAGSTIDFIYGAAASGGSAAVLNVYNHFMKVNISTTVTDSGAAYNFGGGTIRQARLSAGNQITFFSGFAEDSIIAAYSQEVVLLSTAFFIIGIGLDSTTTISQQRQIVQNGSGTNNVVESMDAVNYFPPQTGSHIISANERGDNINSTGIDNNSNASLSAMFRM